MENSEIWKPNHHAQGDVPQKWGTSSPKTAEVEIMLDALNFVKEHTFTQLDGELIVINDDKL